jgi:hypothetical protein
MRFWQNHDNPARQESAPDNSANKTLRHALHLGSFRSRNLVTDPSNPKTRNPISILERRFRRMSENHDRMRARLLASQPKTL